MISRKIGRCIIKKKGGEKGDVLFYGSAGALPSPFASYRFRASVSGTDR